MINIRGKVFFGMWFPGLLPRVACPLAVPWGGTECYAGSSWWRTPVHLIVARKQRKRQEGTGTLVSLSWVHSWSPNILLVDPPLNEIIPSSGNITGLGHSRSTLEQRRCVNMTTCTACQGSAHIPSWHSEGWDWETVSPPWLDYFRKKKYYRLYKRFLWLSWRSVALGSQLSILKCAAGSRSERWRGCRGGVELWQDEKSVKQEWRNAASPLSADSPPWMSFPSVSEKEWWTETDSGLLFRGAKALEAGVNWEQRWLPIKDGKLLELLSFPLSTGTKIISWGLCSDGDITV